MEIQAPIWVPEQSADCDHSIPNGRLTATDLRDSRPELGDSDRVWLGIGQVGMEGAAGYIPPSYWHFRPVLEQRRQEGFSSPHFYSSNSI